MSMNILQEAHRVIPLCPVFNSCGGCVYQDLDYAEELRMKDGAIKKLFSEAGIFPSQMHDIVASPKPYHYRNRLDLAMKRTRDGVLFGFQSEASRRLIPVETCSIASSEISDALISIRDQAMTRFTDKYLTANIVIRTGQDKRVLWGGIGRRSLELKEEDYLFTEIHGKKIYYSLDTFFQANLSILPLLMDRIKSWADFSNETVFYDLYSGVGLFGIYFADQVGKVVFVENVPASVQVLHSNLKVHSIRNALVYEACAETILDGLLGENKDKKNIVMVDPPRKGLHVQAAQALAGASHLKEMFYLSCHPESLMRDLKILMSGGWRADRAVPFDFFPKTKHIETLVLLKK